MNTQPLKLEELLVELLPIDTCPIPDENTLWKEGFTPVLVWNGERLGEATIHLTYEWDEDMDLQVFKWAWTHHSTCSCCHSYMEPQPTHWAPMPRVVT